MHRDKHPTNSFFFTSKIIIYSFRLLLTKVSNLTPVSYTHLYIEFPIHSLGYEEFLRFFNLDDNNQSLYKYLTIGGMPYLRVIGTEEAYAFEYLRNVYSTILLKAVSYTHLKISLTGI